jgi:dTDP-glucose 4,6-dehydratase
LATQAPNLSPKNTCVMVTGGAGFIGSAVIRRLVADGYGKIVNVDLLTYAGNLESLIEEAKYPGYEFEQADIRDSALIGELIMRYEPHAIMHLAAESHVDRSIDGPGTFVSTNISGTYNLLEAVRAYNQKTRGGVRTSTRFHHISTDEVYGSLGQQGLFTEDSPYQPNSPYSATKAAADHLVRAWGETFGLDFVLSNCSNNYGPYQYPEKLIPVIIQRALCERSIPVYGRGENIRDWLFVDDHAKALVLIMSQGESGRTYNVGGDSERTNIAVVEELCRILDETCPRESKKPYADLIEFTSDRPGHDFRYAIDASRIRSELGWRPEQSFEKGLRQTVKWYLANPDWVTAVSGSTAPGERRGLGASK